MEELIKKYFETHKTSLIKPKQLAKHLKLESEDDYQNLKQLLHKLKDEGFLLRNGKRYKFYAGGNSLIGKLQITKKGFGFVKPIDKIDTDIFIPFKFLGNAFDGDVVLVKLFDEYSGKNPVGEIIKIVEKGKREFVGKVFRKRETFYVQPEANISKGYLSIKEKKLNGAKEEDKVIFRLIEDPKNKLNDMVEIIEVLGRKGEHKVDMMEIAHQFKLPTKFSNKLDKEIALLDEDIIKQEIKNRKDIRDKVVFTIDPVDAKDFDDALSIEKINDREYQIGIHIADVSFFIPENSKIDLEARERGTSVYLVNYVIPMLPEKLTNNICSLVPNKDRLCYSVFVNIDITGKVKQHSFAKTVINSKRRYSYEEVEKILDTKQGDYNEELQLLNGLSLLLKKERMKKGSIDFFSDEVNLILDLNSQIINVKPKLRLKSHSLIEEFMLLANKIVAREGLKYEEHNGKPFIYRIHDLPDEQKIKEIVRFIKILGYKVNITDVKKSKNLQKILDAVKDLPEENLVSYELLRSMAKAVYSTENIGHFGLAFSHYTHFTSPIRRYPDLMVHRLLNNYLNNNFPKTSLYSKKKLDEICEKNSQSERTATDAERTAIKMKVIEYLEKQYGKVFDAIISGVQYYGIFVTLQDTLSEGLINIDNLPSDIYYYDEKKYALKGRISRKEYRLGDKIKVKIMHINKAKKEIDFELAD